jgi:hypothetical protein
VSPRPTDDAEAVLDIRANPQILLQFTRALTELDFVADGIAAEGQQHRWKRDRASIDVLIPDNVGERLARRTGVTGSPTVQTPGGIQALHRSQVVAVDVAGRPGHVPRPSLVGALIMKAAAHTVPVDPNRGRHRSDFATLAALVAASDFVDETLSKRSASTCARWSTRPEPTGQRWAASPTLTTASSGSSAASSVPVGGSGGAYRRRSTDL